MRSERAAGLLRQKLAELNELLARKVFHSSEGYHYNFRIWYAETEYILNQIFGEDSRELKRFAGAVKLPSVRGTPAELSQYRRKPMVRAGAELKAILSSMEEHGVSEKREGAILPTTFITHGGEILSLNKASKRELLAQLKQFHKGLARYKQLVLMREERRVAANVETEFHKLRLELQRKYGSLKPVIEKYGSSTRVLLQGGNYECEAFTSAFGSYKIFDPGALEALVDTAIVAVNTTIGNLQSVTPSETSQAQVPEDSAQMANFLFDKMQFHLKVVEASRSCFVSGNYREAILNAFIKLIDYVKEITGLDLDGDDLMNRVFSFNYDKERRKITKYPLIRINELKNISDRDEQQGFMFLCKGAVAGIRNPKAHTLIPQTNPLHTLEYLALASLLIRRIEESKVVKSQEGASS